MQTRPRLHNCSTRAAALLIALASLANAGLITTLSSIPGATATIDFSQFKSPAGLNTKGPAQVGGMVGRNVVFTSTNPDASLLSSSFYTLGNNGTWGGAVTYAGLDVDIAGNDKFTMKFSFNDGPVLAVGGFLNYARVPGSGFSDAIISVLSSSGAVLESYDLNVSAPISTPGGNNAGAFRGIFRPSADISAFTLSNSAIAITSLTFSEPAVVVPEPVSLTLLGSGLGLIFWLRRRSGAFNVWIRDMATGKERR